jgi:type IX secretion system PorP/SprF family membrane protein
MFPSSKYLTKKPVLKHSCLIVLSFVVVLLQGTQLKAQDYHFSQFYAAPLLTNPANTGTSGEDLRIANIYRNQWAKIGAPYETFSTSIDKKMIISDQLFGIGGAVLHDQSSSFNLTANEFILSISYSKIINNQQFTIGIQPGFVARSYNLNGLTFGSQFDLSNQLFNSSLPSLENGLDQKLSYFDLNAGISWRTLIKNMIPSAGISVSHLNMPEERFSTSSAGTRLPMRMTFNGELLIPINKKFDLTPCVLYSYTPGANEFLPGSILGYEIGKTNMPVKKLYGVAMFRVNPVRNIDAFILGGGAEFMNFNLGMTYDLNISPLSKATNFNGAFEISLIYTGRGHSQKKTSLPCYILN